MAITSIYAAILALLALALVRRIVLHRRRLRTGMGDGGDEALRRAIRAHANLVENAPLFLILFACAEYQGLAHWALHGFGVVFVAGRLMHAYSLLIAERYAQERLLAPPHWRKRGMMCTLNTIGALALVLLSMAALSLGGVTISHP